MRLCLKCFLCIEPLGDKVKGILFETTAITTSELPVTAITFSSLAGEQLVL